MCVCGEREEEGEWGAFIKDHTHTCIHTHTHSHWNLDFKELSFFLRKASHLKSQVWFLAERSL